MTCRLPRGSATVPRGCAQRGNVYIARLAPCQGPKRRLPGYAQMRTLGPLGLRSRKGKYMSFYENVFLARQEISTQQADALAETFANVIVENGGTVPKRENWGLKSLSFRIKKNRKGHYILLNIEAPAAAINEMERQMRLHEDIIRHMTGGVT